MKDKEIIALLKRAAAAIETPNDLGTDDKRHVVEDLLALARARQAEKITFEQWRTAACDKLTEASCVFRDLRSRGISEDDIGTSFAPDAGPDNVEIVGEPVGAWVKLEIWVDVEEIIE